MEKEINFKKLLCYNIVNNNECLYKNKCMFAHSIEEQKKDLIREHIYYLINICDDLSTIDINENKELLNEFIIYTKECKNCLYKKCPGGFNCKFGVCLKELKICYNDLIYGKCFNYLREESTLENKLVKRCCNGIHLTEKKLIPYQQRLHNESNFTDLKLFVNDFNYGINNRFNTLTLILNDNTIEKVKQLLKYNTKKLNEKIIDTKINLDNNSDTQNDNTSEDTFNTDDCLEINQLLEDIN
jgi:hypothetical protein